MGTDFKINEYGEIIREDNELFSIEQKYLKGAPLNIEVRKRLAAESQNLQVLETCLKERAITVRRIVWDNPYLTPELRKEATRQKLIDKGSNTITSKINKSTATKLQTINPSNTSPNPYTYTNDSKAEEHEGKVGNKGCLWIIIIVGLLGALFSYLSGEMWFPF